jgi:hypothetical protein
MSTGGIEPPSGAAASNGAARGEPRGGSMPERRELFALAAVLAATVVTMAAAIAGLTRTAGPAQSSPPTVSQIVGPAPAAPPRVEPGD